MEIGKAAISEGLTPTKFEGNNAYDFAIELILNKKKWTEKLNKSDFVLNRDGCILLENVIRKLFSTIEFSRLSFDIRSRHSSIIM